MANTRVKVRREVLIEKLTAERDRIVSEHGKDVARLERERTEMVGKLKQEVDAYRLLLDEDADAALSRLDSYYRTRGKDGASVRFPKLHALREIDDEPKTYKVDRM